MILLFEGPDGAGKSTMIKAVAAEHLAAGYPLESTAIWRAGPFPQDSDPWTEYVLPLMSLSASRDWLVLVDRWHVGELVYGPIFRGGSRLSEDQRTWIDGFLRSMGGVLVHLTASTEELTRRISERGDDMVGPEHVEAIRTGFVREIDPLRGHKIYTRTYDTTGQRTQPTAAAIYLLARQEAAIAESAARHPSTDITYMEKYAWPT